MAGFPLPHPSLTGPLLQATSPLSLSHAVTAALVTGARYGDSAFQKRHVLAPSLVSRIPNRPCCTGEETEAQTNRSWRLAEQGLWPSLATPRAHLSSVLLTPRRAPGAPLPTEAEEGRGVRA